MEMIDTLKKMLMKITSSILIKSSSNCFNRLLENMYYVHSLMYKYAMVSIAFQYIKYDIFIKK